MISYKIPLKIFTTISSFRNYSRDSSIFLSGIFHRFFFPKFLQQQVFQKFSQRLFQEFLLNSSGNFHMNIFMNFFTDSTRRSCRDSSRDSSMIFNFDDPIGNSFEDVCRNSDRDSEMCLCIFSEIPNRNFNKTFSMHFTIITSDFSQKHIMRFLYFLEIPSDIFA